METLKGCLLALLGALAGGAVGIGVTYVVVAPSGGADALTWFAAGVFFVFVGMLVGMGVALWLGRGFANRNARRP